MMKKKVHLNFFELGQSERSTLRCVTWANQKAAVILYKAQNIEKVVIRVTNISLVKYNQLNHKKILFLNNCK